MHGLILMVDLGDLREGIWPDEVTGVRQQVKRYPRVSIEGLGANLACFSGVVPSEDNMNRLVELAEVVERHCDITLRWVSGANSSGLQLMASGRMPRRINHARIGEAILLGRETVERRSWPETH